MIESNIDDMPPEFLGYLMDRIFKAGALDLFFTPIQMKKNRPATKISVLAKHEELDSIAEIILTETTTFGLRYYEVERKKLLRSIVTVDTKFGVINVKQGYLGEKIIKAIPEYEDCKRLAQKHNVPISQVYEEAIKNVYDSISQTKNNQT